MGAKVEAHRSKGLKQRGKSVREKGETWGERQEAQERWNWRGQGDTEHAQPLTPQEDSDQPKLTKQATV